MKLNFRQSMHLTFLGTGPSRSIPRPGHSDAACRDARRPGSKTRRLRSSVLVSMDQKYLLIDATPDVLLQLRRDRLRKLDTILLTHAHADAAGGIIKLDALLRRNKYRATLSVEQGTLKRLPAAIRDQKQGWLVLRTIVPGKSFLVAGLPVIPFRVAHSMTKGFPALGYRIGKQLVYASDVSAVPKSSEQFIRRAPHLVLDGCMWFDQQIKSHLSVDQSIALAERLRVKHLYLTQISHTYPPHREAERKIRAFVKQKRYLTRVTLAFDGLTLSIS
ncbi:MBL fold metallo-hydrolase [Candidatus Uhrbacteria bacterium]|nr:MBL fold metallo-hydrolase [Candidatus Uhrbacteria bacterium]